MRTTVRKNPAECTGCGACVGVCPKRAISMKPDSEGFLYPAVDGALCVECNLCEKRCPVGKAIPENKPMICGAIHKEEDVRAISSSGGVFTALARQALADGYAVFGAAFDERFHVEHVGAVDEDELAALRGSKYVQSDASDAIGHAQKLLERGLPVFFTGTPCQIAGLLSRVREKDRKNLLTMDIVCHGVGSPGVFETYLRSLEKERNSRIVSYTFRDKRKGWKDFSAVARFEDGSEHVGDQRTEPYLYGFLQNLYLRPSCAQCENLRLAHHPADITIADYWGADRACPERDDDRGMSLVFANTQKGRVALEKCRGKLTIFPASVDEHVLRANPCVVRAAKPHEKRERFFRLYAKEGFRAEHVMKLLAPPGPLEKAAKRAAHLPVGVMRRLAALGKK